jgi:hypothetical protein
MDSAERDRIVKATRAFFFVPLGRARRRVVAHLAARARILALIASRTHAELPDDPAGGAHAPGDVRPDPEVPLPQLDVITLVAAPSAPPRALALTVEVSTG